MGSFYENHLALSNATEFLLEHFPPYTRTLALDAVLIFTLPFMKFHKKNASCYKKIKQVFIHSTLFFTLTTLVANVPFSMAYAQALAQKNTGITLNFVNADIEQTIKAVGLATNKTYIIDPRIKGTISLIADQLVSKDQAMQMLEAALRLQGIAMVADKGFIRVVPESDAKLQGSPIEVGNGPKAKGGQVLTQVFQLRYESAMHTAQVLRPLISPNNTINAYPGNNSLIITDYADNLRRLARIIAAMDNPSGAEVTVIALKNAIANDVAAMIQRMFDANVNGLSDPSMKATVMADPRTNTLLIRTSNIGKLNSIKALIAQVDQPTSAFGNIYVVPLKNANAAELAQMLRALVAANGTLSPQSAGSSAGGAANTAAQQGSSSSSQSTTTTSTGGSSGGSSSSSGSSTFNDNFPKDTTPTTGGTIQADIPTNSLIITASAPVYRNLRQVIDQLDVRRAQVYIESMIVEINSTQAAQLGIQWQGLLSGASQTNGLYVGSNSNIPTSSAIGSGTGNIVNLTAQGLAGAANATATSALTGLIGQGLNIGWLHNYSGKVALGAILNAMQTAGTVNLLSAPNLVTLDNEEAKILVGQNIPMPAASYPQAAGSTVAPYNTYSRQDVGIILRVKPQITQDGVIKMQIYQESSSLDATTLTNASGPSINKRALTTMVLVNDSQMIVLGGLIEDNYNDGQSKVPLLGDIPIIGALFRSENKTRSKNNLLVFIRPRIIADRSTSDGVTQERYNYMRGMQQNFESSNWFTYDKDTPQLPQNTPNGALSPDVPVSQRKATINRAASPTEPTPTAPPVGPNQLNPLSPTSNPPSLNNSLGGPNSSANGPLSPRPPVPLAPPKEALPENPAATPTTNATPPAGSQ